jgi:hypothetical protein
LGLADWPTLLSALWRSHGEAIGLPLTLQTFSEALSASRCIDEIFLPFTSWPYFVVHTHSFVEMSPTRKSFHPDLDLLMIFLKRRSTVIFTSLFLAMALVIWYQAVLGAPVRLSPSNSSIGNRKGFDGIWKYERDKNNLILDGAQCEQAFPGLFEEIERPVKDRRSRRISLEDIDSITPRNGYVRAMIYDQQVI